MDLGKTTALTNALCKLCNYCMDENNLELCEQTKMDTFYLDVRGVIPIEDDTSGNSFPKELIGGSKHTEDCNRR